MDLFFLFLIVDGVQCKEDKIYKHMWGVWFVQHPSA